MNPSSPRFATSIPTALSATVQDKPSIGINSPSSCAQIVKEVPSSSVSISSNPKSRLKETEREIFATTATSVTSDSDSGDGANDEATKSDEKEKGINGGRWTREEHENFLIGLKLYGREWKKVAEKIKTRTSAQIRSHAQKYFAKKAKGEDLKANGKPEQIKISRSSSNGSVSDAEKKRKSKTSGIPKPTLKTTSSLPTNLLEISTSSFTSPSNKKFQLHSSANDFSTKSFGRKKKVTSVYNPSVTKPLNSNHLLHSSTIEDLLAVVSPAVKRKVISLGEDEMCAIHVLATYTSLSSKMSGRKHTLSAKKLSTLGSKRIKSETGRSLSAKKQKPNTSSTKLSSSDISAPINSRLPKTEHLSPSSTNPTSPSAIASYSAKKDPMSLSTITEQQHLSATAAAIY